MYYYVIIL